MCFYSHQKYLIFGHFLASNPEMYNRVMAVMELLLMDNGRG